MATLDDINFSRITNSPVAVFGKSIPQTVPKVLIYRGEPLRYFLYKNGADPQGMRQFLILNRIGRVFEMEVGIQVQLPSADSFKRHPDSV